MYKTLLVDVQDRIATIIINRPEKLNALNAEVKGELHRVLSDLRGGNDVHVIIVTGAGDKAFVAGTDIGELSGLDRASGERFAAEGQALFGEIERCEKPVIAAVNGYALGGGCELAMACHIRIASDRAKFGQPELTLGILPGYGGTQRLARLVGLGKATEMILTGVQVDAHEALRIGLVNRVVPHSDLRAHASRIAGMIASMGQLAVRRALSAVQSALVLELDEGLANEARLFGECCATEDFREGTRAFLEKRKPEFRGA